ncbi:MAG: heme NO-binding domain-containing protein [Flammeovirgaceae bacterium]
MKGIIFSEFLEMVEQQFGIDVLDHIIQHSDLPSGGSYTAVGTYHHSEMVALVISLSQKSGISVSELLKTYGAYQFKRFAILYPTFFDGVTSAFDFLEGLESYIHPEVRKLYPDAELPRFDTQRMDENTLQMTYKSERHLGDFAEGLIQGCLSHFQEQATISQEKLSADEDHILFSIIRT